MPLLKSKNVTYQHLWEMLDRLWKLRRELYPKGQEQNFIEYLHSIPKGKPIEFPRERPVFEKIREFRAHRKPLPKGETAVKLISAGRRLSATGKRELQERGYSQKSIAAVERGLAESAAGKTLYRGSFAKYVKGGSNRRRKRVLLPEFKKLMSKETVGNTQDDLDAVRGDR